MKQTKVSVRGQTVIPQEIRERFDIKPNTKLAWSTRNGVIIVVPIPEDPVAASVGILAGKGYTLDDFLREREQERELDRQRDARLDAQIERAIKRRQRGQQKRTE
jgi:AbrB family looped-hinge helix DNA binding protein